MYKSKSFREIQEGATRTGANRTAAQRTLQANAPSNGRWNKGVLPKGSNRKVGVIIGGTRPRI